MNEELVWSTINISCDKGELNRVVNQGVIPFLKTRKNDYKRYQFSLNSLGANKDDTFRLSILHVKNDRDNFKYSLKTYLQSLFENLQIKDQSLDSKLANFLIPPELSFLYSKEQTDEINELKEVLSSVIMNNVIDEQNIDENFIYSLALCLNLGLIKAAEKLYHGNLFGLAEYKPRYVGDIHPEVINIFVADNEDLLTGYVNDILIGGISENMFFKWIEVCENQFNKIVSKKKNHSNIDVLHLYDFLLSLITHHLSLDNANISIIHALVKRALSVSGMESNQQLSHSPAQVGKTDIKKNYNKARILYLYDMDDWAIHNVGKLWLEDLDTIECTFKNIRFVSKHQFKNYDFVWFGCSFFYNKFDYDLDKSIIAVHDPIELHSSSNIMNALKKAKYVVTISQELHNQLLNEGVRSQLINTKSNIPYADKEKLITKKCDIHSIFNPSSRKNVPLMHQLQFRSVDKLKLNFDLKTGTSLLPINDYISLFDSHEVYVCTSLMEGGPLPAMDAMHRGEVVLTTPVGQIQDLIEDGKNGFICRSENDFMEKIELLANNLDLLHDMRKESLASIKRERQEELIKSQVSTFISNLKQHKIKLNLGGIGSGINGWRTVNLVPGTDIKENILDIGNYCRDNSVDEFMMSHTYEHLPVVKIREFLETLLKKLKKGGKLTILHTDIKRTLELYKSGEIDFFCLRDLVFTPIDRRLDIFNITGEDLQGHKFMWGSEELKKELLYYGFSKVEILDGGTWPFDIKSFFPFQENEKYFGVQMPNLKVEAYK